MYAIRSYYELDFVWDVVKDSKIGDTGYTYVTRADGIFIAHPDDSVIFTTGIAEQAGMETIFSRFARGETGYENYTYQGVDKTSGFAHVEETGVITSYSIHYTKLYDS